MIKKLIIKIKESYCCVLLRVVLQQLSESFVIAEHIKNSKFSQTPEKIKTEILITLHALEKGMSIGNGRIGFGKEKCKNLISLLNLFLTAGGDADFVKKSVSMINGYIAFNKSAGADMMEIEKLLSEFCKEFKIEDRDVENGIINMQIERDVKELPFDRFSSTRFSVRDLSNKRIDIEIIKKALVLAERTPSACNRQSWRVHVYTDERLKNNVFKLQGGAKGFYEKLQSAIIICADIRRYGINELNLPFVDGGLYGMNLLYALHYYGLATIPLTMGHKQGTLRILKKELSLPANEIPVLLVGVGSYCDTYKVARSERLPYNSYTTFNF